MAVPEFSTFFLPILKFAVQNSPCSLSEMRTHCAELFHLTEDDLSEKLKSGRMSRFYNRIQWAKTYLVKAGLMEATARGVASITESGNKFLSKKPKSINIADLEQFPEFIIFNNKERANTKATGKTEPSPQPPNEQIEEIIDKVNSALADELLNEIKNVGAKAFEQLVLDVIRSMGYGIDGKTTQYIKDGGIDGVIREDKLGLNEIYLQAKLWDGNVGSPAIQQFIGVLDMRKAQNGICIAQSDFTPAAIDVAAKSSRKIILINGKDLVKYMIKYGVGVQVCQTYELKKLDLDYFESIL